MAFSNPSLFHRLESGLWVFCVIPPCKLSLFPRYSKHTFHKGLRGNSTHSFSVRSSRNSDICVVRNVMLYPNICCLVSYPNICRLVDMSQGYLFHATSKAGQISDEPFTDSQLLIVLNSILQMLAETVTKLPKAFTLDVLLLRNCWEFLHLILPSTYVGAPLAW